MRQGLTALLVLLSMGCARTPSTPSDPPMPAQPTPSPSPLSSLKVIEEAVGRQNVEIILPPGYTPGGRYPLLVFFHSYRQDSRQLSRLTRFARFASELGWISACGDLDGEAHWGNPQAIAMHREMLARLRDRYQADPQRTYYVGFSMGGGTALLAAMETKGTIDEPAAVASSQGWSNLSAMKEAANGMYSSSIDAAYGGSLTEADLRRTDLLSRASELGGTPVYLEHGDADQYVPASQSRSLQAQLESLEIPGVLKIYPGLGHTEQSIHEGSILNFLQDKIKKSFAS